MPVKKNTKKVSSKAVVKKNTPVKKTQPAKKSASALMAKSAAKVASKSSSKPNLMTQAKFDLKKIDAKKLIKPLIFLLILAAVYLIKDEVIVASVNGKPVTRWALIRNLEKQSGSAVLENMTLQMLVEQQLQKEGIKVSDEEMEAELAKIEEQLAAQGQNLDDLLKAQGLTRAAVKEQLSLSKGMEMLLSDKVAVTDEEVTAYFEENKELIGKDTKFEDVKTDIENQLKQQKLSTEQQKWFAEIKKAAKINYFKFAPSVNLQ
jgi:foldase protein PrsA